MGSSAQWRSDPSIGRFDVAEVLQGFSAVFRAVPSMLQTWSTFGATATPVGASAGPDRANQALHPWHLMGLDEVMEGLGVDGSGLSHDEAQERLKHYGENALEAAKRRSDLVIFLEQFNSLPVALLGVSAVISAAMISRASSGS